MSESVYQLRRLLEGAPGEHEGQRLTCLPSPHDPRDYKYAKLVTGATEPGPIDIDYRPNLPPVINQGQRGSCVAVSSVGTTKAFQELSQGDYPAGGLSAAFVQSISKTLDGIPDQEGTFPRVGMQVLQQFGVCPEVDFPYRKLSDMASPWVPFVSADIKAKAEKYKIQTYAQICSPGDADKSNLLTTIRQALAREGPFVLALLVCDNFVPGTDGKIPLPQGGFRGGHQVGIVGDLPDMGSLILRNSWGTGWGHDGYALLPYEWLTSRYDGGWYVYESWTATDIVVPRAAREITIKPDTYTMNVDGQEMYLDEPATLSERNRILLPLRAMAGNMGYLVEWDGQKATLRRPN